MLLKLHQTVFRLKEVFSFISWWIQSSWIHQTPLLIFISSELPLNNVTFLSMSFRRNLQNFVTESSYENHIWFISLLNSEKLLFVTFFLWSCINVGSILIGIQSQIFSLTFVLDVKVISITNECKSLRFSPICSAVHYDIIVFLIFP